ncbi:MAG: hypothetical protein LUH02_11045 [Erysipelotrichaceae bacterium]|nr:hypothetical protein [Erysipelotrichaceae bacterium]
MSDFNDFDIEMYDENINQDSGVSPQSTSLACVGLSAALSWATVSVSTNTTGTSMACATLTNITE